MTHRLDASDRLFAELSAGLPVDPVAAEAEARRRIAARGGEVGLKDTLSKAYAPRLRAHELGVDRYPAVVFDGTQVVYGIDDVAEALGHYRAYRAYRGRGVNAR